MKQAIITGFGNAEKIGFQEVKTPKPQQNEVLVKVVAVSVNPKDTFIILIAYYRRSDYRSEQCFWVQIGRSKWNYLQKI